MRSLHRALSIVVIAGATACGGFLGFGDDDDEPVSSSPVDGGATSAEGGNDVDALAPGCERHAIRFEGFSGGEDAAVEAVGWQSNEVGNATLAIESGRLVARSLGVGDTTNDEANVSFRRNGNLTRVTCNTTVEVSSFTGISRFVWFRLVGDAWPGNYDAYAQWDKGQLNAPVQGVRADGGGSIDVFDPRSPAPPPGRYPLFLDFDAPPGSPATFTVRLGDVEVKTEAASPVTLDYARLIFGAWTPPGSDAGAYEIRYDAIECVTCVAP